MFSRVFHDISKARDKNGEEIVPEVEYDGFIRYERFITSITDLPYVGE